MFGLSKKKKDVIDNSKHLSGCTCLVCKPIKIDVESKVKSLTKSKKKDTIEVGDAKSEAQSSVESDKGGTNGSKSAEKVTTGLSKGMNSGYKPLEARVSVIEDRLKGNDIESGFWVVFATLLVIGMIVMIIWWLPQAGEIPFIHRRF